MNFPNHIWNEKDCDENKLFIPDVKHRTFEAFQFKGLGGHKHRAEINMVFSAAYLPHRPHT